MTPQPLDDKTLVNITPPTLVPTVQKGEKENGMYFYLVRLPDFQSHLHRS